MAQLFRSISFKIFGVSVALLTMMVAIAFWSANSSAQVHRQLRTLEQSLFPLALTLGHLEVIIQEHKVTADFDLQTPDMTAVENCLSRTREQQARARALLSEAERYRSLGAEIAVLERNKLALARLQPMLSELSFQHSRLVNMMIAGCAFDASEGQMEQAKVQAEEVLRQTALISEEIDEFVSSGARVVNENQALAMRANLLMIATAALVGCMLAWLVARGLTRPIIRLQAGAKAVGAGLLNEAYVRVTSRDEIGEVTEEFNAMITNLKEKEKIKDTFGQYVDPRIVNNLLDGGQNSSSGERQIATIFFSDMVGFSSISERLAPSTLVNLMNNYFSEMAKPIRERSGIVDKYIGDAIMAFWVPPFVSATKQAELACSAALEQFQRLDDFRARIPDIIGLRRDVPLVDFRVGLCTGDVVVGSLGSDAVRSFTVMGDTVNQASRLEAVNKLYGTRILVDQATYELAGAAISAREIDTVAVIGKQEPLRIFELAGISGTLTQERQDLFSAYADALSDYRKGAWSKARTTLVMAQTLDPTDGPTRALLARIDRANQKPPSDWSGVWQINSK